MPLEGEAKRLYNKEYHRREREQKQREAAELQAQNDVDGLSEGEVGDAYLFAECRTVRELQKIYNGIVDQEHDDEDEDEGKKKKAKVKKPLLVPRTSEILGSKRSFMEWLKLRDRARKDLFWLAHDVLMWDLMVPHVHQVICDQFVKKNFDGVYSDKYVTFEPVRQRMRQLRKTRLQKAMIIDPRGFFKSTIDGVDAVQWLLNAPDISILIVTGVDNLATTFRAAIKLYFTYGSRWLDFQLLFPEYVITGRASAPGTDFRCPARKLSSVDPSVFITSMESAFTGKHCDVVKCDDAVTIQNSNNAETRASLKGKIDDISANVLNNQWGFIDFIGTRYYTNDWYGTRLKSRYNDEGKEVSPIQYFCRSSWIVKDEFKDVPLKSLEEHMVTLTFPEKMDWTALQEILHENEQIFRCQQLNEPIDEIEEAAFTEKFTEDDIYNNTIKRAAAPQVGDIVLIWDTAYTDGKRSDFTAGAAIRYHMTPSGELGMCVLKVVFGRWKAELIAEKIIELYLQFPEAKYIAIENAFYTEAVHMHFSRLCILREISPVLRKLPIDRKWGAKKIRILDLRILLTRGLLKFVDGDWMELLVKQFTDFIGSDSRNRNRKDDIPDVIAIGNMIRPKGVEKEETEEDKKRREDEARRAFTEYLFSVGNYIPQPTVEVEGDRPSNRGPFQIPGFNTPYPIATPGRQYSFGDLKKRPE